MDNITVYALSTCPYCKKAIRFLKDENAEFEVIFLDKLDEETRKNIMEEMTRFSKIFAVPLIVKGKRYVIGFDENAITDLLKK